MKAGKVLPSPSEMNPVHLSRVMPSAVIACDTPEDGHRVMVRSGDVARPAFGPPSIRVLPLASLDAFGQSSGEKSGFKRPQEWDLHVALDMVAARAAGWNCMALTRSSR